MISQTPVSRSNADPINFENYALLYDDITAARADLDDETCRFPIWCILPDDRELRSHWADVISVGQSLAELLDASDAKYSSPTSPAIMVGRYGAMEIGGRLPFDNNELLQRRFPPSTRQGLETLVQRFRDVLLAYFNLLLSKVRDILYSTRIHGRLMNSRSGSLLLLGSLILDEANFERFRLILQDLDDGDDNDFEHYEAVQEVCESLKAALEGMNPYISVTETRPEALSLLTNYLAVADSYREELLSAITGYIDYHIRRLPNLNPRWSYPGEPAFSRADEAVKASTAPAFTPQSGS